jgi:[acyl-carrier-protein] S-malonyltransferase
MSVAFVFPGQGSQSVGMMASWAEDRGIRDTFAQASEVLGYDLWTLTEEGPAEQLALTEITQPLMLVAGVAVWRAWCAQSAVRPDWVAGHSLGEFTALVAAGALSFAEAVDLVRYRGEVMRDAVPAGEGAMAAVLGLSDEQTIEACAQAAEGEVVEAVNFNAPSQVVIAGHRRALERAMECAKSMGAKRALLLPISVPCHSSLMSGAAEQLRDRLASVVIRAPEIRFMSSVDAYEYQEPESIRALLYRQLASPVRWVTTMQALILARVSVTVECGPGKVLAGLQRRIDRSVERAVYALDDATNLASVAKTLASEA